MPPVENIWHSSHIRKRRIAFCNKIDEYFKEGMYTDVNIICENRKFKCHRVVLAAASEYFHRMFSGDFAESQAQDVVLHDFDSVTFEKILLFVYRGEIATICDDNVFNLLRVSDMLGLNDLEDHCVHYLTQKNIPMDCALEIYLFASALRKVALIPAISRFILQHLDRFSQESKFLQMSFEDVGALLTYFHSSSTIRDRKLLKAILGWVCCLTDDHENRKSSFMKLVQKGRFEFISTAQIAEYFDQNSVDSKDGSRRSEESETSSDMNTSTEANELSLHVYIGVGVKENIPSDEFYYSYDVSITDYADYDDNDWAHCIPKQTSIFSLRENNGKDIDWQHSFTISSAIERMRIVESGDRLYYLKFDNERCTFSSSTAFDLCTNVRSLALPSTRISMNPFSPFSLCGLQKKIYLSGFPDTPDTEFHCYDTELDIWSSIPILSEYKRANLMSDESRLYMIDRFLSRSEGSPLFAAFDPRVGKFEELNGDGLSGIHSSYLPGCYHRGRIYLLSDRSSKAKMSIYDLAAGRWEFQSLQSDRCHPVERGRRLVSFRNRLWMLRLRNDLIFTRIYDSFLQEWNEVYSERLCPPLSNFDHDNVYKYFTDVLAFKSS